MANKSRVAVSFIERLPGMLAYPASKGMLVMFAALALFAGMPVACILVTFNGELLECNELAKRLLKLPNRHTGPVFLHRMLDSTDSQPLSDAEQHDFAQ